MHTLQPGTQLYLRVLTGRVSLPARGCIRAIWSAAFQYGPEKDLAWEDCADNNLPIARDARDLLLPRRADLTGRRRGSCYSLHPRG